MNGKKLNLIGRRFGKLLVIDGPIRKPDKQPLYWRCRCDCGNAAIVRGKHLVAGQTKSCGCLHAAMSSERMKKLHATRPQKVKNTPSTQKVRLYRIWESMRQRCNNPHSTNYSYYGGRGIKVCDEWDNYEVFEEWAYSHGYREHLTIDRIDNDGNYCPDNCRWVTMKEQAMNKRKALPRSLDSMTEESH